MSVIEMNQFRQPLVNKRDNYIEYGSNGILPEKLDPKNGSNSVTPRYYAILNECVWDNNRDNFIDVKFGSDIDNLTRLDPTYYEVNPTTSVITFEEGYIISVPHYAFYKAGGSIVWVQDVTSLQKACVDIDNNTVYKDGSVTMTGNFNLGNNNILNVNSIEAITVDTIRLRNHSHTAVGEDAPQITADGLATNSVQTSKINDYAVTEIKIASDAVTTDKVMDESITLNKLHSNSVNNDKIVENTIRSSKLFDNTVENIKIKTGTIEFTKLNTSTSNANNVLKGIFNILYPVGSVYITTNNTCPIETYVGTWELVSKGRVLQGANDGQTPGSTIEAGLPNITGEIGIRAIVRDDATGAFYRAGTNQYPESSGGDNNGGTIGFKASRGEVHNNSYRNDVYGKSDTVQPPAYLVNIFKRIS